MGSHAIAFGSVLPPCEIYEKHFLSFQACLCHNRLVHTFPSTDVLVASATLRKTLGHNLTLSSTIEGSSTNPGGLAASSLYPEHCSTLVEDITQLTAERHPAWHRRQRGVRENRKALYYAQLRGLLTVS
jgi:hypothetical protein